MCFIHVVSQPINSDAILIEKILKIQATNKNIWPKKKTQEL